MRRSTRRASLGSTHTAWLADYQNSYQYNAQGQLIQITQSGVAGGDAVAEKEIDLSYNEAGLAGSVGSWLPGQNMLPVYDTSGQLTAATYAGATGSASAPLANESYTYDANGNRTGSGYVIGPDNELLCDGTYTYTYDAEGNCTAKFIDVNHNGMPVFRPAPAG